MPSYLIKRRPDKNHREIVDGLCKAGIAVIDLADAGEGVADIVTHYGGNTVFIEIKAQKDAKLKKKQIYFLATWKGHCGIAQTFEEAKNLAVVPEWHALSEKQKEKLLVYWHTMTAKEVHLPTILKILALEEIEEKIAMKTEMTIKDLDELRYGK